MLRLTLAGWAGPIGDVIAAPLLILATLLRSDGLSPAGNFTAGASLGVFGESGSLKPSVSVDVTLPYIDFWLSGGARFNPDMASPYVEAGAYLLANVGGGVSYVPNHGALAHIFVGLPVPIMLRGPFIYVEPYLRNSFDGIREYGILVKSNFDKDYRASCPHVYSFDGQQNRIDGDMLSGAFSRHAESNDLDRLEHLTATNGQYRVRIANDLEERDYINQVELLAVDHSPSETVLPTLQGQLVRLGALAAPSSVRDSQGQDALALVAGEDARVWRGHPSAHDPDKEQKPEDSLDVTLPAPAAGARYLVVRVRNTDEATQALYNYLGRMGPGIMTLLERQARKDNMAVSRKIDDELERLGVPLHVSVRTAAGWKALSSLRPVGPAAARYQLVPLPAGDREPIQVRLTGAPGGWEIDRVAIATGEPVQATSLPLMQATGVAHTDIAGLIARADEQRLMLRSGQGVDLFFQAPPASTQSRSLFLRLRGYYEVDFGGFWINPIAIYRDRTGSDSAPRFFLRSLRTH